MYSVSNNNAYRRFFVYLNNNCQLGGQTQYLARKLRIIFTYAMRVNFFYGEEIRQGDESMKKNMGLVIGTNVKCDIDVLFKHLEWRCNNLYQLNIINNN